MEAAIDPRTGVVTLKMAAEEAAALLEYLDGSSDDTAEAVVAALEAL